MNEIAVITKKTHTASNERDCSNDNGNKNDSNSGTDELRTNHEITNNISEQEVAAALLVEEICKETNSISYDNIITDNYTMNDMEDKEHHRNKESPLPTLVNSSFDSSENSVLSSINRNVATFSIDSKIADEAPDNAEVLLESSTTNPSSNTTILLEEKKDGTEHINRQMVASDTHLEHVVLLPDTASTGLDVNDGLQGFLFTEDRLPIVDVDTLFAEACHRIAIAKDFHDPGSDDVSAPLTQQRIIQEDHSESLTGSFYSCRDEASVNDNMNSDVSFHTALDNHCISTINSMSQSEKIIDDNLSQPFIGYSDFLDRKSVV